MLGSFARRPFLTAGILVALMASSAPAFATWSVGSLNGAVHGTPNPVARPILKVHTEYKNGVPTGVIYFIGPAEVVALANLESADVQGIKKVLDDAFVQGKKITLIENRTRNATTAGWYDVNDVAATVTFYYVFTNDNVIIRLKP